MKTKIDSQIQIRIDNRTKNEANKVLEKLGLNASTAVKMLFKQIINTGSLPFEIRDINGFRPDRARELEESIKDAEKNKKSFSSAKKLISDLSS